LARLYVGNLAHETNESQLRAAFAPHAQVTSVKLVSDRRGRFKGFAYVDVADSATADAVIEALRGAQINGRTMDIVRDDARRGGGPRRRR